MAYSGGTGKVSTAPPSPPAASQSTPKLTDLPSLSITLFMMHISHASPWASVNNALHTPSGSSSMLEASLLFCCGQPYRLTRTQNKLVCWSFIHPPLFPRRSNQVLPVALKSLFGNSYSKTCRGESYSMVWAAVSQQMYRSAEGT